MAELALHCGSSVGVAPSASPQVQAAPDALQITVVVCTAPRQTQQWALVLPPGSSVADALRACATDSPWRAVQAGSAGCGVWGRAVDTDTLLCDQDRVEVYRALKVDPKVARRERFAKQGARTTGLFAGKRPGAKAGY